jgi:hypothetical protein
MEQNEYRYIVTIGADSVEKADQVIIERLGHDEDYGFDYTLAWEVVDDGQES